MFHMSSLALNLILISLISLSSCEPLTRHRRDNVQPSDIQKELDAQCPEGYNKQGETKTWKHECNTCLCSDVGRAACTGELCDFADFVVSADNEPKNRTADPRCVNNSETTWKEDCNNCFCVANPPVVACTRMTCVKPMGGSAGVRFKRDSLESKLREHFSHDDDMQSDQPFKPHPSLLSMNSGTLVQPNVWIATAALSVVTALLARI